MNNLLVISLKTNGTEHTSWMPVGVSLHTNLKRPLKSSSSCSLRVPPLGEMASEFFLNAQESLFYLHQYDFLTSIPYPTNIFLTTPC
jgi:hypothetical protein